MTQPQRLAAEKCDEDAWRRLSPSVDEAIQQPLSMSTDYDPRDPLKDATRCGACGAATLSLPHLRQRWVCGVCGTPKIYVRLDDFELSGREIPLLRAAKAAKAGRMAWTAGGIGGGLGATAIAFITLLGKSLFGLGWLWTGVGLALFLPFALLAVVAIAQSRAKGRELEESIEQAWLSAARDVAERYPDGITGKELAEVLPIDQKNGEELLARLTVDDAFHTRITEDGALSVLPAQLRIEVPAKAQAEEDDLVAKFDALAEREAEAEAHEQAANADDKARL